MADTKNPTINQVTLLSGNVYDLEDAEARQQIKDLQGQKHYIGTVTDASENKPADGAAIAAVTVSYDGEESTVTPTTGQTVIYGSAEFLAADDGKWHKFGDHSDLKDLAYKDSATATYTPKGSIAPAEGKTGFTGTEATLSVKGTPSATVTAGKFTGSETDVSVTYDKVDAVNVSSAAVEEGQTANYTPAGDVEVKATTDTVKEMTDAGTLPSLTTTVENGNLKFGWSAGTLPTSADKTVATGASATFKGTGTVLSAKATTASATAAGTCTPQGSVAAPGVVFNELTSTGAYTPEGEVGDLGFTGTQETITSK